MNNVFSYEMHGNVCLPYSYIYRERRKSPAVSGFPFADLIRIGVDAPHLGLSSRVEQSCFPFLLLTARHEATGRPENCT
jgi:hypothetical protein